MIRDHLRTLGWLCASLSGVVSPLVGVPPQVGIPSAGAVMLAVEILWFVDGHKEEPDG